MQSERANGGVPPSLCDMKAIGHVGYCLLTFQQAGLGFYDTSMLGENPSPFAEFIKHVSIVVSWPICGLQPCAAVRKDLLRGKKGDHRFVRPNFVPLKLVEGRQRLMNQPPAISKWIHSEIGFSFPANRQIQKAFFNVVKYRQYAFEQRKLVGINLSTKLLSLSQKNNDRDDDSENHPDGLHPGSNRLLYRSFGTSHARTPNFVF